MITLQHCRVSRKCEKQEMKPKFHLQKRLVVLVLILTINVPFGHSIGCYTCKSGVPPECGGQKVQSLPRNEPCESGRRSADYAYNCVPNEEPMGGTPAT